MQNEESMQNEEPKKEPSKKALIAALNQNWLHCRHLENERLSFTSIYSVIVTGALALLGVDFRRYSWLLVFLLFLSIMGLSLCLKIDNEFKNHMQGINKIMEELHLRNYLGVPISLGAPTSLGVPTSFSHNLLNKLLRLIRVRNTFLAFYLFNMLMWFCLLIYRYIYLE